MPLLSCFSCVQLCATLWTVFCQFPLSMGFSRQEYWSGLLCPPPGNLPDPEPQFHALQVDSLPLSHWGNTGFSCTLLKPILRDKSWLERKGGFIQEANNLGRSRLMSKANSEILLTITVFKGRVIWGGDQSSLSSIMCRLSPDWLVVR